MAAWCGKPCAKCTRLNFPRERLFDVQDAGAGGAGRYVMRRNFLFQPQRVSIGAEGSSLEKDLEGATQPRSVY